MPASEQTLGVHLRDLRRKKTWSMLDLSSHTGLNYQHLSRIENDSIVPTPETVVKLATALGGDLNFMLRLADCLPRQILDRLSASPNTPAMRRAAAGGARRPAVTRDARAKALAREMGVAPSELADVADAMVRFLNLEPRRRQLVVQLMKTFDEGGRASQR